MEQLEKLGVRCAYVPEFEATKEPHMCGYLGFRVGTCEGLWRTHKNAYEILAVHNGLPGNGHFRIAMLWFENSARRDDMKVIVHEIWNFRVRQMLKKHGYTRVPWTLFTFEKAFYELEKS